MPSRGPTMPRGQTDHHHHHCHSTAREPRERIDYDHCELYVQICYPQNDAVHWLIFMKYPGAEHGTRFHSTGWMGNRELSIETNKRFDSQAVESTQYLGTIHETDSYQVHRESEKIPLQSCQLWACYLILRLERKRLLKKGTYDHYMNCYEHSMGEHYGPGDGVECRIHLRRG
ncbi:hypothetical protein N7491_000032 [Penicillium cf. griseofulvum]|uniref:Uncharacterized protein n=1 Tax=Penicillium cf. griseofulvum TaxID=2972120 RepID=A0A9W9JN43_9EURO|nr:hypothetical protein N7472_004616 [Penicillium cf. griseofulvum]KAJ5442178.1 hypothetical protein N7445_005185 [Penicillium cf. griseofulvum]KAJ5450850.1 hypothetical protein N7491_000032 [Penicillium cf. griseofulvum]